MIIKNPKYDPRPKGAVSGMVKTPDGINIRYARWKSTAYPVLGTVLLLQGRAEYIEKQYETVSDLRDMGFEVISFDWRGQGGSDRLLRNKRAGFVEDFDHYILDLDTIMNEIALPDCRAPFFILAHSTGALVTLLAAPSFSNRIRRMVLTSPLLGLGKIPLSQPVVKCLSMIMCALGLGETYLAGNETPAESLPFAENRLTSDSQRFERNHRFIEEYPELATGGPTASWLFAAIRAMDRVHDPDFYTEITIPTLLVAAGNDTVVSNAATDSLSRRLRSGSGLTIPGARHEILQERDIFRAQFLAAFQAFVPGSES